MKPSFNSAFFYFFFLMISISLNAQVPDKASPFTAVKWEQDQPVVQFEGQWYDVQSIHGVSVDEILDFCKKEYDRRWQKRFSEDLVEVLTTMGHLVEKEVNLVLVQNGTEYSKIGTMSEDNRDLVRDYNNGIEEPVATFTPNYDEKKMAEQMAEWMDQVWENDPPENAANLRFMFYKDGAIFQGKIDIQGDFIFRAESITNHTQALNPNLNGRWVYEELPPGKYNLSISGKNEHEGWMWVKKGVEVAAKTKPVFEIHLD